MANTPQFTMRLRPDVREHFEQKAKRENRSLANVIETALIEKMEADRKAGKKRT